MKPIYKKLLSLTLAIACLLTLAACNTHDSASKPETSKKSTPPTPTQPPQQKYYTVTFDYYDGSGRFRDISIPEGETIGAYAPKENSGNAEIIGWSTTVNGADFVGEVYYNMTLYAKWQTYELKVYDNNIPNTISDPYVEIRPEAYSTALQNKIVHNTKINVIKPFCTCL